MAAVIGFITSFGFDEPVRTPLAGFNNSLKL
jgi:hypothetical protein